MLLSHQNIQVRSRMNVHLALTPLHPNDGYCRSRKVGRTQTIWSSEVLWCVRTPLGTCDPYPCEFDPIITLHHHPSPPTSVIRLVHMGRHCPSTTQTTARVLASTLHSLAHLLSNVCSSQCQPMWTRHYRELFDHLTS